MCSNDMNFLLPMFCFSFFRFTFCRVIGWIENCCTGSHAVEKIHVQTQNHSSPSSRSCALEDVVDRSLLSARSGASCKA